MEISSKQFGNVAISKIAASLSVSLGSGNTTGLNTQAALPKSSINNKRHGSNLNNTIGKARTNTDLQPLHKDSGIMAKPMDLTTQVTLREKNQNLSHIIDGRIKKSPLLKI